MNLKSLFAFLGAFGLLLTAAEAPAFCGFYVAKADASLFNNTSEVILVRDQNHSVITMSSDFQGDVSEFAMVVPVPVVLNEQDIRVVRPWLFDQLNNYSAPRLVEYYDHNPCQQFVKNYAWAETRTLAGVAMMDMMVEFEEDADLGVTIEAQYLVGEYDILILSAKDSKGLKTWLTGNGYQIPGNAHEVLDPYIKNQLKFFVVKVNEQAYANLGSQGLSPIQITYESDRFMLPIRLGMANSKGTQDMVVYTLTRQGRVECTNYRNVEMPTGNNIPLFVKPDFGDFYVDLFDRQYTLNGRNSIFTEYAWTVTPSWGGMKCDPCVGPPPMEQEFADAGVDWLNSGDPVFFTRMHVRYSRDKFPQDLQFQVTPNKQHYQARYVLTHSASGDFSCEDGQAYLRTQRQRRQDEVDNLQALTGWQHHKSQRYITELDHLMNNASKDTNKGEVLPTPVPDLPPPPSGPGAGMWVLLGFFALLLTLKMLGRRTLAAG